MAEEKQADMTSWDDFTGLWLKPEHFKKFPDETFVASVHSEPDDKGRFSLYLELHYNGRKWKKQLNQTDIAKLKTLGVNSPEALVNHAIIWEKVKVFNPSERKHVDSITVSDFKK